MPWTPKQPCARFFFFFSGACGIFKKGTPPTNIAPDMGSLEEESNLPGTCPELPC